MQNMKHRSLPKICAYLLYYLIELIQINLYKQNLKARPRSMTETAYEIERILDEEIIDAKPHYLIKWKGYSSVEATWEPIENLIDTLDLVHEWKLKNGVRTPRPDQPESESKQDMGLPKTKKISNKDHDRMEKEFQDKLNLQTTRKRKVKCLSSDQEQERLSLDEESQSNQKDMETNEYSFGEDYTLRKTRSKASPKSPSKQSSPSSSNTSSTLTRNKLVAKHIKNSSQSQYTQSASPSKQTAQEQLSGFKVVGKVTKQGIETILWCFDWEDQKICEVQLKDGRKVNMKREDVKKICPGKLLEYYEKIEKARI